MKSDIEKSLQFVRGKVVQFDAQLIEDEVATYYPYTAGRTSIPP